MIKYVANSNRTESRVGPEHPLTLTKILIPIVWAGFILWTVRKLWRPSKDPALAKYEIGARLSGIAITLICSASAAVNLPFPGMPFWFGAVIYLIIAFPVSLWVGYGLGRCFRAMDS
jgi:hypothetical protein